MKKILLTALAAIGLGTTALAQTPAELAGKYYGELYISLGEPLNDESVAMPMQCVDITASDAAGCVNFAIYNFALGDMQLGDIVLPAIGTQSADGTTRFAENPLVDLCFLDSAIIAKANLEPSTSWIKGDSIYADVNVSWDMGMEEMRIYVRFVGEKPSAWQAFNGGFNFPWTDNRPWDSANGYDFQWPDADNTDYWNSTAYKRHMYIQPDGWTISNVSGMNGLGATLVGRCDTISIAENGAADYAVTLTNTPNPFMASQIVPGYITLGTSWAAANAMGVMTGDPKAADGGAFGGVSFKELPDALTLRYKRSHDAANATEPATVVAYLWKGTYTQAEVPANTAFGAPTTCTMTDRDRNILGKETTLGGEVTKTADAACIASLEEYIEGDAAEWQELTAEFNYGEFAGTGVRPEKMNIIISANDYFGDRAQVGNGNSITVDDVQLVYWSTLRSLAYEGEELGFAEDKTSYDLSQVLFDANKLSFAQKGQGATVSTSFNDATAQLTIRVEGADIARNPGNATSYVVTFKQGSTGIAGVEADRKADNGVYSISGVRVADKLTEGLAKGVYIVGGKKVVIK